MSERKMIYLCLAHMSEEGTEQKYVKEAFDTNWVVPMGPNVNAFEKDLEAFVAPSGEATRVVCLSAGTAAVHLALIACGVQPGDEVCVQSFTFCASSHPITYIGAKPVFIDSERETWNMDPELLEKAIIDRKEKTGKYPKAIIPVALYGMPYDCERIMAIADKYGIPVIEDAAEGMGSRFDGRVLGTFGRFGVLSFNGNKMITTSGGGALICGGYRSKVEGRRSKGFEETEDFSSENESIEIVRTATEDANEIMWYATQARDAYPYYQHTAIGYNYRMSNVCAGIGRGQMTILNDHIAHHKHVQALYEELLADVPGFKIHKQPAGERYDSNFWLCTATLEPSLRIVGQENAYKEVIKSAVGGAAGVIKAVDTATTDCQPNDNVEALRAFMLEKKIEARPVWKPMHKQPVYTNVERGTLNEELLSDGVICQTSDKSVAYINGVSEEIFKVGICLPAGPCVTDEDVHYIVECIKEAIV